MPERELRRVDQLIAVHAAQALAPLTITGTIASIFAGIPSMIMSSGLAATGAFLLSRAAAKTSPSRLAYRQAATALLSDAADHAVIAVDPDPARTLDNIVAASGRQYLMAEARSRLYATWLARLAAARVRVDANELGTGGEDRSATGEQSR